MLRDTDEYSCEASEDRMENREEEESVGSSKDDEIPSGSCSASTSEADEIVAISSVKSELDADEKVFSTQTACSGSEAHNSESQLALSSSLPPSSSRLMRNLAEKMRRDKLNMYISELSSLVPIVAMATKRMDKTSVLRLSANFLRIHLSLKQNRKRENMKLAPLGLESNLSTTLLEALEGFMLIVTSSGKIVYVSESVEKLLGHSQLDLMGQSLYTICHNGDHELLRHHLQPSTPFDPKLGEGEISTSSTTDYVARSPSFFGGKPEDALSGLASGERRSFYARLAERSMARGDPARHVTVHLIGILRPPIYKKDVPKASKAKKDCSSTTTSNDEHLLVCVARPFRNKGITELSLMEAVQDEYVTRHLPDGRIIYSDHRIAFVAGYLTEEVMGMSAFNFIHQDDLPWATVANRQMFSSVDGQGYTVYRLRSKTGTLIHLRTRGYLEFNKTTQKVETFVCINTLLTPEEGDKELEKERERITPFITFQQVTTTSTNSGAGGGGTIPAITQGTTNALPQPVVPITPKIMGSLSNNTQLPTIGISSIHVNTSSVEIVELSEEEAGELITQELTTKAKECQLQGHGDGRISGKMETEASSISLSPSLTTTAIDLVKAPEPVVDHCGQDIPHLSPRILTSTSRVAETLALGTPVGLLPRLKRSLAEVDDPVVTSSAKRSIVPAAFITSYSPLHHSPHLGTKWEAEPTLIFDQHNNNNNNNNG